MNAAAAKVWVLAAASFANIVTVKTKRIVTKWHSHRTTSPSVLIIRINFERDHARHTVPVGSQ